MINAIVFDLDGVLVDSEPYWDKVRKDIAIEAGVEWNKEDHKAVMGVSSEAWSAYMIERLGLKLTTSEVQSLVIDKLMDQYRTQIPFMSNAIETVKTASQFLPVGLASGSPSSLIQLVVNHQSLIGCFQIVVSADEVEHGKPAPDVYVEVMTRMGIPPQKALCVEDSANGILSGKRAGMKIAAVVNPLYPVRQDVLRLADYNFSSLRYFMNSLSDILHEK